MNELLHEEGVRRNKIEELRRSHINPYPSRAHRTSTVADFLNVFDQRTPNNVPQTLTGRVRLKRIHGKIMFFQLQDGTGTLQVVLSVQDLTKERFDWSEHIIDVGDIIEVTGTPFVTKKGEQSLLGTNVALLSKAVRPLPDKWHGLKDEEARYRQRYLDLLMNPELKELFVKKSIFWHAMRSFLLQEQFIEVETPVLETTPGGADAEPFMTHHNALDIDVYLRISTGELWQKRLMVGGFDKTFEIGRQFRNEGMSPEHLQDYTQMEFYWGYADYTMGMELVQRLVQHVMQETFGTLTFTIDGKSIDCSGTWERIDYRDTIKKMLGVDCIEDTDAALRLAAQQRGIDVSSIVGRGRIIDALWKQCRKKIQGPVFLVNHPVDVSPLAKRREEDPRTVERFQIILAGSELGNGYSELNDPIDQRARFEEQSRLRDQGDAEAQMHDEDFVEALEYGMPPTCGFGVSERLFAVLMNKSVRECVLFPLLRPKQSSAPSTNNTNASDPTLQAFEAGIDRATAHQLLVNTITDENLRRHMLATESIMKALATHFHAASPEAWGIAGLLHDIDYERVPVEQHSIAGADQLQAAGLHQLIVHAVREHNPAHGIPPSTIMSKALLTLETLTGLIIATTFVRPDKKIAGVEVKSVMKKFKTKGFAAGVDRELIRQCETLLNLPLEQAIGICLGAMKQDAKVLGL